MRARLEVSTILSCFLLLVLVSKNHGSLVSADEPPTFVPTVFTNVNVNTELEDASSSPRLELTVSLAPTAITETGVPTITPMPTTPTTMPSSSPSDKPSLSLAPSSSMRPSLSPTTSSNPSQTPTKAPVVRTGRPSPQPSRIPSTEPATTPPIPVISVQGRLDLTLTPVTSLLAGTTRTTFLQVTTAFLYQQFPLMQQDSLVVALVGQSLAQRRRLQQQQQTRQLQTETLVLDLAVTGLLYGLNTSSTTSNIRSSFDVVLQQVFKDRDFLDALQDTSDPYFDTIDQVSVPSAPVSPTTSPSSEPEPPTTNNDKDPILPLATIIGIAAGGAGLLLVVAVLICRARQARGPNNKASTSGGAQSFTSDPALAEDNSHGRGSSSPRKSRKQQRAESQSKKQGQEAASELLENQTLYSYKDNASASFAMNGGSPNQYHFDTDTVNGADTMSYAYSLDAGIENSVMGSNMTMDMDDLEGGGFLSIGQQPSSQSRIQIPSEIPSMISQQQQQGLRPPSSHWSSHSSGIGDPSEFGVDPAVDLNGGGSHDELEMTYSDLAFLPSADDLNLLATTTSNTNTTEGGMIATRQVHAPPGKLGIIIDTTVEGPVVHKVQRGSALEEQIWPGDIIVAIDNVDTRAMSATAITQLMVQTVHQRRTLTIVSGEA